MMKKKFAGIAVGASLIIGGGTVDLVPVNLPAQAWAQYKVSEYQKAWTEKTATGTIQHVAQTPNFPDSDGNGLVSYSMTKNKKGEMVYTQISDEAYAKLGKKDGSKFNFDYPAVDKITVAEAMLEGLMPNVAEAAIATDAFNGQTYTTATSITYSHTISGSDTILFVSTAVYPTAASTATYNGTSMTQIGSTVNSADNMGQALFYLVAPTTGTNNVVVTRSGGSYISSLSQSYTGASQTGQPDASNSGTGSVGSSPWQFTATVTSTQDNCWAVVVARDTGDGVITFISGGTQRSNSVFTQGGDSNGPKTPAGAINIVLQGASLSPRAFSYGYIMASFCPSTGGGSPIPSPIIEPIITWW